MAFFNPEIKDCSIQYKTFNELNSDDKIYIISIKNVSYTECIIKEYVKEESKSYWKKNCFEIDLKIEMDSKIKKLHIYDGNMFLDAITLSANNYGYDNEEVAYISTDKRICEIIIDILRSRMLYQWNEFSKIFGNPLAGKYEPRHIKLN